MVQKMKCLRTLFISIIPVLFMAGCGNSLVDYNNDRGKVLIRIAGNEGRTLYPSLAVFDRYSITFGNAAGTAPGTITVNKGDIIAPVELEPGLWTVTVKGLVSVEERYDEAAEGTAEFRLQTGENKEVPITLQTGIQEGIPGIFTWSVTFPPEVSIAEMNFYPMPKGDNAVSAKSINLLTSPIDSVSILPGYYLLETAMEYTTAEYVRSIVKTEVVHIFSGMETLADYTFIDVNFTKSVILQGTIASDLPDADIKFHITAWASDAYLVPVGRAQANLSSESIWEWTFAIPASYTGKTVYFTVDAEYEGSPLHVRKPKTLSVQSGINTGIVLEPSWVSTLFYDGNHNNGGTAPEEVVAVQGSLITIIANSFSRTNRSFFGWNTQEDGTGITYYPGDTLIMGDEDITLYAVWSNFLYYKYQYGGGGYVYITGYTGNATNVAIPATVLGAPVTAIDGSAFSGKKLISVVVPESVTSIGNQAFYFNQLSSISLGNNITVIYSQAFHMNQIRGNLILPANLTYIGENAFQSNQISGVVFSEGLTTIDSSAFAENQLKEVIIPNSVTSIGYEAFAYNYSLTKVYIGNKVTTIERDTFSGAPITDLVIGDNVSDIDSGAFYGNQLDTLVLPDRISSIGENAFGGRLIKTITIGRDVDFYDDNVLGGGFVTAYYANDYKAGTYTYSEADGSWAFSTLSSTEVTIDFAKPYQEQISFGGGTQKVLSRAAGNNLSVSVNGLYDSYTWIVNGTKLSAAAGSITIDPDDYAVNGEYMVTLMVYKNGVPHSAEFTFVIVQ